MFGLKTYLKKKHVNFSYQPLESPSNGRGGKNPFRTRNGKTITARRLKQEKKPGFSNATINKLSKAVGNTRIAKSSYEPAQELILDKLFLGVRRVSSHVKHNGRKTIMVEDINHIFSDIFGPIIDISSGTKKRKQSDTSNLNVIQRTNLRELEERRKKRKRVSEPTNQIEEGDIDE